MSDIYVSNMQVKVSRWVEKNFGTVSKVPENKYRNLLGIGEEVGELMHAHLKQEQGIRHYTAERGYKDKSDALGDIFIYMCAYAHYNGIDLSRAIWDAWQEVRQRDWKENPDEG